MAVTEGRQSPFPNSSFRADERGKTKQTHWHMGHMGHMGDHTPECVGELTNARQ